MPVNSVYFHKVDSVALDAHPECLIGPRSTSVAWLLCQLSRRGVLFSFSFFFWFGTSKLCCHLLANFNVARGECKKSGNKSESTVTERRCWTSCWA